MSERERPREPSEHAAPAGLGNPFGLSDDAGGAVTIEHGVYMEQLPLGGRTVGEIRPMVAARYDIDPRADAFVDGRHADYDAVVRPGQSVRFMHISGEKGQTGPGQPREARRRSLLVDAPAWRPPARAPAREPADPPRVTLEGDLARAITPEGRRVSMKLEDLLARLDHDRTRAGSACDLMLPDGVKTIASRNGHTVAVHQTPPAVHNLRWIAARSPARHGRGTLYRQVRIALPYVIVFAVFEPARGGAVRLGDRNECFFTNAPLKGPDDPLHYPALLNCSKIDQPDRPLSWICTQHLVRGAPPAEAGLGERLRHGLADILQCLLGTGFNYSSEVHEVSSWFSESTRVGPRIATVERWEEETCRDPMFVLEVPWLTVGKTVAEVVDRCLTLGAGPERPRTSHDLARILRTHGRPDTPDAESHP